MSGPELTTPVDQLHHDCLLRQRQIRLAFGVLREEAARWTPRPMPEETPS